MYILSFAVLAFAVEDIKARDCVITSASPCAFLYGLIRENITLRKLQGRNKTHFWSRYNSPSFTSAISWSRRFCAWSSSRGGSFDVEAIFEIGKLIVLG